MIFCTWSQGRERIQVLEQPRVSYHIDHGREILWILHRKNAGTSLRHAFGAGKGHMTGGVDAEDALAWNGYHTISSIRHPWDRIDLAP